MKQVGCDVRFFQHPFNVNASIRVQEQDFNSRSGNFSTLNCKVFLDSMQMFHGANLLTDAICMWNFMAVWLVLSSPITWNR